MTPPLSGRTVLLTGVTGGIGSATARSLLRAGAEVVGHYREDRAAAADVVAGRHPGRVRLVAGDLASAAGAREVWRAAEERGPVDVLVLNAATMAETPFRGDDAAWDAGWEQLLAVNVVGAGALLREAVRTFADRGGGIAIVVSSWAAEQGSRILDAAGYAASKAAIRNLAQTLARHHAAAGVQVHVLAPGVVDTGMGVVGRGTAELASVAEGLTMGRLVPASEVAEVVAFLATGRCPSLTGATVDLNGASYVR